MVYHKLEVYTLSKFVFLSAEFGLFGHPHGYTAKIWKMETKYLMWWKPTFRSIQLYQEWDMVKWQKYSCCKKHQNNGSLLVVVMYYVYNKFLAKILEFVSEFWVPIFFLSICILGFFLTACWLSIFMFSQHSQTVLWIMDW